MTLDDYMYTQNTINQALHVASDSKHDFALFSSIFTDQVDIYREHIEQVAQLSALTGLESIQKNTGSSVHLKVKADDYRVCEQLNNALTQQDFQGFKLLLSSQSLPLSMHDDANFIHDDIIQNCPMRSQLQQKSRAFADDFEPSSSAPIEKPDWLQDIIKQTQTQFQTL
jgi:hypothetical protein